MKSINEATPREWDQATKNQAPADSDARGAWSRLRKEHPAIEKYESAAIEESKQIDMVNSPDHYTYGSIECIDAIEESMTPEAFKGYCKGAAIKYLWRYERKGKPLEDLQKCQWYLQKLIASHR